MIVGNKNPFHDRRKLQCRIEAAIDIRPFASRLRRTPYIPPAFRAAGDFNAAPQWIGDVPDAYDAVPAVALS
jgi:hypothetical protein